MSLAETARLAVDFTFNNASGPGVASAKAGMAGLKESTAGVIGGSTKAAAGLGLVSRAAGGLGGALGHAKSQIGGLLTGPLGLIGLGGAVFGLEGIIKSSIGTAEAYGVTVARVAAITRLSTEQSSRLVAVFQRYGLEGTAAIRTIGMLEKNVGLYTATTKASAKFTAEFGFALRDSKGHVKDANALILQAADYFNNKHIPATQRALFESKLFGRQWQSLVPILALGSKGIKAAGDEAARLGLVLTKQNAPELAAYHKSVLLLGEAWGGLQLQIGVALMPALTELANGLSKFVGDPSNRANIVGFFKGAVEGAKSFAGFVMNGVVPAVTTIGGAAIRMWNSIPDGVRTLLLQAFIGNKIIKWTFGVDIVGSVEKLILGGIGNIFRNATTASMAVQAGVVNVAGGVPGIPGGGGGVPGAVAGGAAAETGWAAGGLAGLGALAVSIIGSAGIAAAVIALENKVSGITPQQIAERNVRGQFGPRSVGNVIGAASPSRQYGEHASTVNERLIASIVAPLTNKLNKDTTLLAAAKDHLAHLVAEAKNAPASTAARLRPQIDAARAAVSRVQSAVNTDTAALRAKKLSVSTTVNTAVATTVNVSAAAVSHTQTSMSRYQGRSTTYAQ